MYSMQIIAVAEADKARTRLHQIRKMKADAIKGGQEIAEASKGGRGKAKASKGGQRKTEASKGGRGLSSSRLFRILSA